MSWSSKLKNNQGGHSRAGWNEHSNDEIQALYNKEVVRAEKYRRPLGGTAGDIGIKHSGVKLTTEDGEKWLVHKGSEFGYASQTVVTDAANMGGEWERVESKNVRGATVRDYVEIGGKDYNLVADNCHQASNRMMKR